MIFLFHMFDSTGILIETTLSMLYYYVITGAGASSLGMGVTVGIPVALIYLSLSGLTGVFIIWKITQNRRYE